MKTYLILALILCAKMVVAQADHISINGFDFEIKIEVVSNEWGTSDTVNHLYRMENGELTHVLKFYKFKDNGGDCNNLFWYKETLEVENNSLIFNTNYFQKTNMDPIPVKRKQIYTVVSAGRLVLSYDKYKYRIKTNCWGLGINPSQSK